jgi:urease accessory protein
MALDETGAAYTLLVNPSGGLVAGDHLSLRASLGPRSHVIFSTPSANRVYRSLAEPSRQEIQLTVGAGAILEWVPELTIPFLGSRFSQTVHVALESGGTLIFWDALAAGRIASGERWKFTSFDNEIRVKTSSGASVLERYRLISGERYGSGLAEPWDYVASLFILSEAVEEEVWKRLKERFCRSEKIGRAGPWEECRSQRCEAVSSNFWRNRRRTSMPYLNQFGRLLGHYYGVSRSRPCDVINVL